MKFFKNSDGTFNTINVFVVVTGLTFVLLFLLCKNLLFNKTVVTPGLTETTTTTVEWNLCKDCSVMFKSTSIELEANNEEKLKNLVEVKNTNISGVKFSSSNKSIVDIKNTDGDVKLVAGDEVGKATITATVADSTAELIVYVKASVIKKASFTNTVYYAYVGKKTKFDITTSPKNASLKLLDLKSDDESIGSFDEENNFIGKQVGETKVTLTQNDEVTTAVVNVIKNKIIIKVREDGKYQEKSLYEYPSNIDNYVELCVKFEDNENQGYNQNSITYNVVSAGKIETSISSEGPYTLDTNAYIFKAHVKIDQTSESKDNYSIITFSLPDGSKATIKITKE